jgi:hypothetical protein
METTCKHYIKIITVYIVVFTVYLFLHISRFALPAKTDTDKNVLSISTSTLTVKSTSNYLHTFKSNPCLTVPIYKYMTMGDNFSSILQYKCNAK